MKTYKDSYLYNVKTASNDASNQTKELANFITKCHRIDKNSDAFRGVIEDVKRQQSSGYLLSVMMNPYVVLCIGDAPLPRAFSVFDAKDSKSGGQPRVFVDLTGRVEFKNGYYIAKRNEIDKICALITDAMIYMVYRYYPLSLVNNGNIVISSCNCFVSMFAYIIDYLRIIGYSENKKKIQYIIGMYFLINMVGIENIPYARSIAAKVADVSVKDGEAFEILIDNDYSCFENIATFIDVLGTGFRLKGLDLHVFIGKWIKLFGTGTQYATELLTSFLVLVANAYTGSYIVNQRQVEVACNAAELTKLCNTLNKIGYDNLGRVRYEGVDYAVHDIVDSALSESMKLRESIKLSDLSVKDFTSSDNALNEAENAFTIYRKAVLDGKLGKLAFTSICNGIECAYENCIDLVEGKDSNYDHGAIVAISKFFKENSCTMNFEETHSLEATIERDCNHLLEIAQNTQIPAYHKSEITKVVQEMREARKYI